MTGNDAKTPPAHIPTETQWHVKFLSDSLAAVAAGYRDLADRIDNMAASIDRVPSLVWPNYAQVAVRAINEVRAHDSNPRMGLVVQEAAAADVAAATEAAR